MFLQLSFKLSILAKRPSSKCINLLYLNNLKENDKTQLNNIIINKLQEEVKKADINNPIFKYIDYNICDKYNLYSIGYKKYYLLYFNWFIS